MRKKELWEMKMFEEPSPEITSMKAKEERSADTYMSKVTHKNVMRIHEKK